MSPFFARCVKLAQGFRQGFDLAPIELVQQPRCPAFAASLIVAEQLRGKLPEVLPRMVEIDDLNRAGEVLVGQVPDPEGTIAKDDLLLRSAPAAAPGLGVEAQTKLLGPFDGGGVGGGILVAERPALVVGRGLRKEAA